MKKTIIALIGALVIVVAGIIIFNVFNDNSVTESEYVQEVNSGSTEVENDVSEKNSESASKQETEQNDEGNKEAEEKEVKTEDKSEQKEEEKVYTPTFMYFVSDSDAKFEETAKMIEELKKEYSGKINFDIRNVDENPEDKENFSFIDGNTPALIMLDTTNNISAIVPMCNDKDTLKAEMDKTLLQE